MSDSSNFSRENFDQLIERYRQSESELLKSLGLSVTPILTAIGQERATDLGVQGITLAGKVMGALEAFDITLQALGNEIRFLPPQRHRLLSDVFMATYWQALKAIAGSLTKDVEALERQAAGWPQTQHACLQVQKTLSGVIDYVEKKAEPGRPEARLP